MQEYQHSLIRKHRKLEDQIARLDVHSERKRELRELQEKLKERIDKNQRVPSRRTV